MAREAHRAMAAFADFPGAWAQKYASDQIWLRMSGSTMAWLSGCPMRGLKNMQSTKYG